MKLKVNPRYKVSKNTLMTLKNPSGILFSVYETNLGLNSSRKFVLTFQILGITGSAILPSHDKTAPLETVFFENS